MPKKRSTKKRQKESLKKRLHNVFYKNKIKNLSKEIRALIKEGDKEKTKELLSRFYKVLDKATKEKIIKKRAADRKKSRIARLINKNI